MPTLLNPILFGVGLACVAIPILIHLLMRQRRKPVRWAAMRFLQEAWRKQRRRRRIEQWVLLGARCLIVALLALAFGRPVLRAAGLDGTAGPRTVHVVIDDSIGSWLDVGSGRAIDAHKAGALALLGTLDSSRGDRASLSTLAGPSEARVLPASNDLSAVARVIEGLEPRSSGADLEGALRRLADAGGSEPDAEAAVVALFTEWRGGVPASAAPALPESWRVLSARPADARASNVAIEGVEPTRRVVLASSSAVGGLSAPVRVAVRRSGPLESSLGVPVTLWLEGGEGVAERARVGEGQARFDPGQREASARIAVDPGARAGLGQAVLVATIVRDGLPADDERRAIVLVRDQLRVGIAGVRRFGAAPSVAEYEPGDWLRIALSPGEDPLRRAAEGVEITELDPAALERTSVDGLDAIWVTRPDRVSDAGWARLGRFAGEGGLVVVTPSPALEPQGWIDGFARELMAGWLIGREPRERGVTPGVPSVAPSSLPLLELIGGELEELGRSVAVHASLELRRATDSDALVELMSAGGEPWIVGQVAGATGEASGDAGGDVSAGRATGGRGAVVLFGSALDLGWTDLPARALMVPLVQEITRQGIGRSADARETVAGRAIGAVAGASALVSADGAQRALTAEPMVERDAGVSRAVDARGSTRGLIVINPDTAGSETRPTPEAEVSAWLERAAPGRVAWLDGPGGGEGASASDLLRAANDGRGLTLWALAAALAVAVVETALARRFSHASLAERAVGRAAG